MKMNYSWIKISLSSNPESFQILALKLLIVQCWSCSTSLSIHIFKYNAIYTSNHTKPKSRTDSSRSYCILHTISWNYLEHLKKCHIVYLYKQSVEMARTYQNSWSKSKTCKQLDLFLITYLHWWCIVINNNKIY
jgi:hypothetical protein